MLAFSRNRSMPTTTTTASLTGPIMCCGEMAARSQNEVHNPGTVSAEDYTEWRSRFGNTSGSGAGVGGGAVPEPATLVLFAIGIAACQAARQRRRR